MNLRLRIFIFNLLTVVAAFSLVLLLGFKMLSSIVLGNTYEKLKLIRVEKTHAIENYFHDIITASKLIASNVATLDVLSNNTPPNSPHSKNLQLNSRYIDEYAQNFNLFDLILIRAEGTIAYATSPGLNKSENIQKLQKNHRKIYDLFTWGMKATRGNFLLLDFDLDDGAPNRPLGYLATPVYNRTKCVGVLIFRITIDQVDQITSDNHSWSTHGLGTSGETLIYGEDWSLRNTSRLASEAKSGSTIVNPSFFATNRGDEDLFKLDELTESQERGQDFRGATVYRSIGKLDLPNGDHWYIQVKIDESEAFSNYRKVLMVSLAVGLLIILIFSILAYLVTQKIMQPIQLLINNLEKLGTTDNFNQKIDFHSSDEVGMLVSKYNQLADRLEKTTVSKDFLDSVITSLKEYLFIVRVQKPIAGMNSNLRETPCVIIQANKAALHATNLTLLEIMNQDLRTMLQISHKSLNKIWLFGHRHSLEADLLTSSGKKIPVLVNWSLLPEQRQNDLIFFFACTDITETHANEIALIKAREEAINASMAKSEFLARMSHEIRTPLNAIIGMTEVLMDSELSDEQKAILSISINAGENLLSIINDILDLSKIEARQFIIEKIPFDVVQVTKNVCEIFAQKAKDKNLDLQINIASSVPALALGDPTRIRQILLNLVGNAIKFTQEGHVEIELTHSELGYVFYVRDTGLGISEEKCSLIFKSFSQADSSITRKYGGTGLGLAICKNLVELMGGEISFTSSYRAGSIFKFNLPLVPCSQLSTPFLHAHQEASILLPVPRKLNILTPLKMLLVDDTEDNRLLLKAYLKKQNFEIQEAGNGLEAVELASEHEFDLIFMDVQMPLMDGYAATAKIREFEHAQKRKKSLIIAISANALIEDIQNSLQAGCDDYIAKPIKKDLLFKILEKHFFDNSSLENS